MRGRGGWRPATTATSRPAQHQARPRGGRLPAHQGQDAPHVGGRILDGGGGGGGGGRGGRRNGRQFRRRRRCCSPSSSSSTTTAAAGRPFQRAANEVGQEGFQLLAAGEVGWKGGGRCARRWWRCGRGPPASRQRGGRSDRGRRRQGGRGRGRHFSGARGVGCGGGEGGRVSVFECECVRRESTARAWEEIMGHAARMRESERARRLVAKKRSKKTRGSERGPTHPPVAPDLMEFYMQ